MNREQFLEDFDDASRTMSLTRYQLFEDHLANWFDVVDGDPIASLMISKLEAAVDFDGWYSDAVRTVGSMVGSGRLKWPRDKDQRTGMHLGLFRAFATEKTDVTDFCSKFLYRENRFDTMVSDVVAQLFEPMATDLRRRLVRAQTGAQPGSVVPASDRVVALDHNSAAYKDCMEALEKLEDALRRLNEGDPDEKEQRQAELSAGRRLLSSIRVRTAAVAVVVGGALLWISKTFLNSAVGKLATYLLDQLGKLLGFPLV